MPDFSVIVQDPQIRSLVQDGILERAFHDSLFPYLLFRGEATPIPWAANIGDRQIFTGTGLIPKNQVPLKPGVDPTPKSFSAEQWEAVAQQYADSIDTHMPTAMFAIANLFYRNAQQLGLQAGQSLNGLVRNRMYNAGLAGHTVVDGAQTSTTSLRVKRLNGFTRARRPDLTAGSQVSYAQVSANNPLKVHLFDNGADVANTVVGFTADTAGDETGPGILTMGTTVTSASDRAYLIADTRTQLVRVGGGNKVDDVGNTDLFTLAAIRSAVATMRAQNVPTHQDGFMHCHMDTTSEVQIFADAEFQRLLTAMPDYYMYKDFGIGKLLGTLFIRNTEAPIAQTVIGGATATYQQADNFAGELFNNGNATTGTPIHRPLFIAQGLLMEYHFDPMNLITEAGVQGKVAEPQITNNGIDVLCERIQLIIRAPQNRLQDMVSTSWKFIGDWPVRTDGAVGSAAYYKRAVIVEHGE